MRAFLLILIAILLPVFATADPPPPTARQQKRIAQIEKDFGAHYVGTDSAKSEGVVTLFWTFLRADNDFLFTAFPFMVPVNGTDRQVVNAIASSLQCARFYELMIRKMEAPSPTPSPTPTGLKIKA